MKRLTFLAVSLLIVALMLSGMGCSCGEEGGGGATPTPIVTATPKPTKTPKPTATPKLTPTPTAAASGTMIQSGVAEYINGAHITFPTAFKGTPVVVASAQRNWMPKTASTLNVTSTGFDIGIVNLWGAAETQTSWVQWIAVGAGTPDLSLTITTDRGIRGSYMTAAFKTPFSGEPVVVVNSAQWSGIPMVAATVDSTATGFDLMIYGHQAAGGAIGQAWTDTIAIGPGTPDTSLMVLSGSGTYGHAGHISFPMTFGDMPTVVVCAQSDGVPRMASPVDNTSTGFTVAIMDHAGSAVSQASVQWIAVGHAP